MTQTMCRRLNSAPPPPPPPPPSRRAPSAHAARPRGGTRSAGLGTQQPPPSPLPQEKLTQLIQIGCLGAAAPPRQRAGPEPPGRPSRRGGRRLQHPSAGRFRGGKGETALVLGTPGGVSAPPWPWQPHPCACPPPGRSVWGQEPRAVGRRCERRCPRGRGKGPGQEPGLRSLSLATRVCTARVRGAVETEKNLTPSLIPSLCSRVICTPRRERNATLRLQLASFRADFFRWVFIPIKSHFFSEKSTSNFKIKQTT